MISIMLEMLYIILFGKTSVVVTLNSFVSDTKAETDFVENFCRERGLEFYAVNRDYPEEEKGKNNHYSRKLKADVWIDDRNVGGLPDWGTIYEMIHNGLTYEDLMNNYQEEDEDPLPKKGFLSRLFRK